MIEGRKTRPEAWRMRALAVAFFAACAARVTHARAAEVYADPAFPPPDPPAGISFEALERLGDKADAELVKRFSDPKNERFREGLIMRMGYFGDPKHPNVSIMKTLTAFVEREVRACEGRVDDDRLFRLDTALRVIGDRGGEAGIDYLKTWATDRSTFERLKCHRSNRSLDDERLYLRSAALVGIGESGSSSALAYLVALSKRTNEKKEDRRLNDAVRGAIFLNDRVREKGREKYLLDARKSAEGREPKRE